MRALRGVLVVGGIAMVCFGLWSMRDFELDQLTSAFGWLAGGVVVHDFVLAPVVVGLGLVLFKVAPVRMRTPLVVAFVLWGSLTLIALPAMSGLGVRPDNPTLLDRWYVTAWVVLSGVTAAGVAAYAWLRRARG